MSLKNYFSKVDLALRLCRGISFFKLLINSKRYSSKFKKGIFDKNNTEKHIYKFRFLKKNSDILMRTFSGDIDIFYEVFWKKAYFIPQKLIFKPKIIVDLGAHIGFTSIYFKTMYPNSKIYSLEASKKNFELLVFNTQNFKNIETINKAVYSKDGFINFNEDENLSYNTKITEKGSPVECISVLTLMEQNKIDKIDLLKIDIEGAESEILKVNNSWLNKVENIIIELHRPYGIKELEKDVSPFGFKVIAADDTNQLKNIFLQKTLL